MEKVPNDRGEAGTELWRRERRREGRSLPPPGRCSICLHTKLTAKPTGWQEARRPPPSCWLPQLSPALGQIMPLAVSALLPSPTDHQTGERVGKPCTFI